MLLSLVGPKHTYVNKELFSTFRPPSRKERERERERKREREREKEGERGSIV